MTVQTFAHQGHCRALRVQSDDACTCEPYPVAPRINAYLARPGQTIRRNGATLVVRHVRPTDDPQRFRVYCCCGSFPVNVADLVDLVADAS